MVEVDASEVGVGAVLSQRSSSDDKVHPCAYFSHRLSPAERNYDIGNRELLAVKLAWREWRHWLEGSGVPFIVWTDHKNLEYIKSAKRLNSRQARWALFSVVSIFLFLIGQVPRTSSPMHCPVFRPFWSPVFFRAHCATENFCFCSHLGDWVEGPHGLARGNASVRMPTGSFVCARDFYGPMSFDGVIVPRWLVILGVSRTMFLTKQRFWWPSMARDIRSVLFWLALFVPFLRLLIDPLMDSFSRCRCRRDPGPTFARFRHRSPSLEWNTVVLTVVDRFLEGCPFHPSALNYRLPERQRLLHWPLFFAFMVSRQTWSLTGASVCL